MVHTKQAKPQSVEMFNSFIYEKTITYVSKLSTTWNHDKQDANDNEWDFTPYIWIISWVCFLGFSLMGSTHYPIKKGRCYLEVPQINSEGLMTRIKIEDKIDCQNLLIHTDNVQRNIWCKVCV